VNLSPDRLFARIAAAGALAVVAALALAALLLHGASRSGALAGLVAAGASGAVALAFLRRSVTGSINALLKAIVAGFLTRMAVVGVGLVVAIQLWTAETALPFAAAFFGLFFLLQSLEFTYAHRAAKIQGGSTP
jgi:hypothetical protein